MAACSFRPASPVPGMLVFSTSRPIVSVGGTTHACPGLALASAATTTPPRSGNGRGLAVLGIAVPQAVWSLLPAGSRGMVALAVPEGASGWGMLHSGDLLASSDDFTVPATTTEVEGLLSPTSAVGSYSTIPVGTFSGVRGFLFSAGNCFGVRDEGKRGAAALAMPKHASSGWGFNTRPAKLDLLRCRCTSDDGQYAQEFLAKLAEVRRQASLMHVIVGDTNTNEEVDNATRTCTGVLIDVVMAADLGREEWKMKMQDAVDLTVVFEDLSAEVRAGVVINRSLKNGIRCIRKLADLVAHEAVLPAPWYADELEEFARMVNKELYFRALMDEFSQLAEVVKSVVAVKLAEKP